MKIVIAGSRNFEHYEFLEEKCNEIIFEELDLEIIHVTIISGRAQGADQLGEYYAKEYGFKLEIYPAEWGSYGRAAGMIRNLRMLEEADYVILFNMDTPGTNHMLNETIKKRVPHKNFLIHE